MEKDNQKIYDVAIVGGGPAGMSAAIYTGRAHLDTCLIEALSTGGQMFNTSTIENYPGFQTVNGPELSSKMEAQVRHWGIEPVYGEIVNLGQGKEQFTLTDSVGNEWHARTVIAATGSKPRKLEIPGETELTGSGVSYCATCDGAFFKGKEVVVVGGGDSAIEESLYLARIVKQVTVVHRRDSLRATMDLQKRAFAEPNIKFIWDASVEAILGDMTVDGLRVRNIKDESVSVVPAAGVFIYIGNIPNTEFLQGLAALDETGYVIAGEDTVTNVPGLFAAGDIRTKGLRQIVTALGDGAVAAMAAERYLASLGL
ncbi:MAG: thioredoxin-disulfide reductase [Firmicutes bacterium]|nr:thioredoxin-disulfide reductase [Bacillota bacterium]